jgi:uncharacterized repeat protein (TIGR02543 family)
MVKKMSYRGKTKILRIQALLFALFILLTISLPKSAIAKDAEGLTASTTFTVTKPRMTLPPTSGPAGVNVTISSTELGSYQMYTLKTVKIPESTTEKILSGAGTYSARTTSNNQDDIIVDDNKTFIIENTTFQVDNRSIIVKDKGTLIIKNAIVKSKLGPREDIIKAYDNAIVFILNSKLYQWANIHLAGDNVSVKIENSMIEGAIGFGWGGGKLRIINTTFSHLPVWASGADILIENSTTFGGGSYITGNSSLLIRNSRFKGFALQFGSTLACPGPIDVKLSIKNGFMSYWNLYKNSTINKIPFNVTIIDSYIESWEIGIGSAVEESSTLNLFDSEISRLELWKTKALISNSKISYLLSAEYDTSTSVRASMIKKLSIGRSSNLTLEDSSVDELSITLVKDTILSDLQPGKFSYRIPSEANPQIVLINSSISAWSLKVFGASSIILKNSYIRSGEIYDNAKILVLYNSTLLDFQISDNATIILQRLLIVTSMNGQALQGAKISLNGVTIPQITTDVDGKATLYVSFKVNNQSYRKNINIEVVKEVSNVSRYHSLGSYNLTNGGPIYIKAQLEHLLKILLIKENAIISSTSEWHTHNSVVRLSSKYIMDAIPSKKRYVLTSYKLNDRMLNISRTEVGTYQLSLTINQSYVVAFHYTPQYYLTVISQYGNPQGEGWYDAGSIATFSVTSPVGFIIQQVFTGWSGDSTATTTTATILMDNSKTVIANWRTDYTQLYAIITIAIVIIIATILVKHKK